VFDIKQNLILLRASITYNFQIETAYAWSSLASVFGLFLVAAVQILFVNLAYANMNTIGGYTKEDMMLFMSVGYMSYVINSYIFNGSIREMIVDVNKGSL